jgi:hypothetical protein
MALGVLAATVHGGPRPIAPADTALELLIGVTDEIGRAIPDLSADDLEVLSEGRRLPVTSLTPGPAPIDVVLLFDISESGYQRSFPGKVLKEFVNVSVPTLIAPALAAGDNVRVGTFARETHISEHVGPDSRALANVLELALSVPAHMRGGPSPIWDAVDTAISGFKGGPRRRAVILMTDGRVTGSRLGLFDVVPRALAAGVLVDVISIGGDTTIPQGNAFGMPPGGPAPAAVVRSDVYVRYLAEQSGGLFRTNRGTARPFTVTSISGTTTSLSLGFGDITMAVSPGPLFAEMLSGLRRMYSVGIIPPAADGRVHPLDVRVRRPGAQVQAPRSFAAPKHVP